MKLCYLTGSFPSYRDAAAGNQQALLAAGATLVPEPHLADVTVLHDEALWLPRYFESYPCLERKWVIGYCCWEADPLDERRRRILQLLDGVWTPSRYSYELFAPHHERVTRVPHLVERREPRAEVVKQLARRIDYDPRRFYFYTIADGGNPRKNLAGLLAAFAEVHRADPEGVRLLVKQYHTFEPRAGEQPGVISIEEQLPAEHIAALHTLGHVYVSAHRSEAWGLGMSTAMAHGNPVVATGYSGNLDFMSEHDGYPVPYRLRHITAAEAAFQQLWSEEMRWAEVDPAALVAALRAAWQAGGRDPRAWRATAITARYGLEALTRTLAAELAAIARQQRAGAPRAGRRSAGAAARPRIGVFHRPAEDSEVILGRQRAAEQLAQAYSYHGRRCSYAMFVPDGSVAALSEELRPGRRLGLHGRHHLGAYLAAAPLDGWHDFQLDTFTPFAIRERSARPFPVTILHHTISYAHLLRERWLPLLLAKPHRYDAILCSSTAARDALRKVLDVCAARFEAAHGVDLRFRGRYPVIPLGVDTKRFAPRPKRLARQHFDLDPELFVLLWVGRLSPVDKADLLPLVQVLAQLQRRHSRRLMLCCCGTERAGTTLSDMLQEHAATLGVGERLRVMKDVSHDDLPLLYAAADVLVSPSDNLQESFGLAVVEAMAAGLPQVVSDWNGYRDTVVDGETGFTIPTYWADVDEDLLEQSAFGSWTVDHLALAQSVAVDTRAMIEALSSLIDNEPLRQRMAQSSRRRAEEHYSWPVIVEAHEALWQELCSEARERPEHSGGALAYATPHYVGAFDHYPTRLLGDEARLALTDRGRALAQNTLPAPLHHSRIFKHLDARLLRWLIGELFARSEASATLSFAEAIEGAQRQLDASLPAARVRRHLLWLLKYDFVSPAGSPGR